MRDEFQIVFSCIYRRALKSCEYIPVFVKELRILLSPRVTNCYCKLSIKLKIQNSNSCYDEFFSDEFYNFRTITWKSFSPKAMTI